jgi:hypothetical protein
VRATVCQQFVEGNIAHSFQGHRCIVIVQRRGWYAGRQLVSSGLCSGKTLIGILSVHSLLSTFCAT